MATVVLVRHGRSTANTSGVLAGRLRGVQLDEHGERQVRALGERLQEVPLVSAVTSPLERCVATATAALAGRAGVPLAVDDSFLECDYGAWQGRTIKELASEALWSTVQTQPSAAVFPEGESMVDMSSRVVRAVRAHDARVEAEHGPEAVWLLASHGDPLKAIVADALGLHLDQFQRLVVDPASVSVVRYTATRPYVLTVNSKDGDLRWLAPTRGHAGTTATDEAVPGGGAGPVDEPV